MESPEVGACAIGIKRKYPSIPLIVKLHTPGVLINRVSRYYQPLSQKLRFVVGSMLRGKWDAGYWSHSDKDQLKDKEYLITAMADAILSPSVALKKWAVKFWKLQPEKISVVPNPFTPDSELFGYPFDGRPPIITFVGKLSILKGLIGFTAAIPMILDKYPGYKLKIVGRDTVEDGKSMLKYMKTKLSAYLSRIEFTGALPAAEVHKIYSTSRLCIMPSLWENYPTVILEAMAAGCPVIATNKGGIPEMIEHGKTGLLFDAKSTKDLLKQTGLILENKNIRCEIAQNARIKLRENTLIDIGILNVYERFNKQRSA